MNPQSKSNIPPEVQKRLDSLAAFRNMGEQEINFRRMSGRRYNQDFKDIEDEQLVAETQWYRDKIDETLAPYETEDGEVDEI